MSRSPGPARPWSCARRRAAVVVILGANGVALAAAAGALLTATGTAGAVTYAGWAGIDRLCALHLPSEPRRPAIGVTR